METITRRWLHQCSSQATAKKQNHLALAMLLFDKQATIHEHAADFDVDVICLEGAGFTSVGKKQSPLIAGDRVR